VTNHSVFVRALTFALVLAPGLVLAQTPGSASAASGTTVWVNVRDYPSVDFGSVTPGDAVPGQPGKVFQHKFLATGGGGWYIADGATTPASQVLTSAPESDEPPAPPMQDEWGYTEAYSGVGTKVPVLVRTANPDRWFSKGTRYIAPYADFRMTILDRVKLPDGNWAWIGQITQSGGAPARGTILSYPLYGDRNLWLTEEEFASAVQANSGR
jgi:hypothetical protein